MAENITLACICVAIGVMMISFAIAYVYIRHVRSRYEKALQQKQAEITQYQQDLAEAKRKIALYQKLENKDFYLPNKSNEHTQQQAKKSNTMISNILNIIIFMVILLIFGYMIMA